VAGSQVGDVVGDAPVDGEQQAQRELRDSDRVAARDIGDEDATGGSRVGVDRVGAGARPHHQSQPVGRLQTGLGDLGAPHHQCLEPVDPIRKVVGAEIGLHHALVAPGRQGGQGLLGQRVRHQHAHASLLAESCPVEVPTGYRSSAERKLNIKASATAW
jgi:hypothetical protein